MNHVRLKSITLALLAGFIIAISAVPAHAADSTSTVGLYTVANDIDNQSPWNMCQSCAGTGTATCTVTQANSAPALTSAGSAIVTDTPTSPNPAYANCLWWQVHTTPATTIQEATLDLWLYFSTGEAALPQAIEFEFVDIDGAHTGNYFEYAIQADFSGGHWRTFDRASTTWQSSGATVARFTENTWHHLTFHGHRVGTAALMDDYITLDGVFINLSMQHSATATTANQWNTLVQLDGNSSGQAYSMAVDQ